MRKAWSLLSKVTLLLLGSLVAATSQAGNIRGAWDPVIGGSYQNTGFRGEVTFFIPDACLTTVGYKINGTCGTGDMQLLNARVWLYDTTSGIPPYPDLGGMPLAFGFWDPVQQLFGIDVAFNPLSGKNEVVGLDTEYLGPVFSGYSPPTAPEYFYLFFASGSGAGRWEGLDGGAYLLECEWNNDENCDPAGFQLSNRGDVTYTPEPGTLSLLFGALGVGWFARRRKTVS